MTFIYLKMFRFPDAAVWVDVCDVNRGVALVGPDPAPDSHPQALAGVLLDVHCSLGQLGSLHAQGALQK